MYKIVLLRHGESEWNAQNKFTGWIDIGLTELGREQAQKAGKILKTKGFVFDLAFTSALQRASRTLEIVLQEMGLADVVVESSWLLNERHYGALQGVDKKEAVKKFGAEQVMIWRRGYKTKPTKDSQGKAESLADVVERVTPYWQEKISPAILQGKKILISAHGNSIRALVKMLDRLSEEEVEDLNIPVGIPLVYELDDTLKPIKHYYLADPEQIEKAIKAVKDEIKT